MFSGAHHVRIVSVSVLGRVNLARAARLERASVAANETVELLDRPRLILTIRVQLAELCQLHENKLFIIYLTETIEQLLHIL